MRTEDDAVAARTADARGHRPGSRPARLARGLLAWIAAPLVLLWVGYRVAAPQLVDRADAAAERDPQTGWRVGMGERDLGPQDSPGAVLMVHGFVGGWNNFAELPDRLAEAGWRVRMARLPGHGTSPRDYAATTPEELEAAVMDELRRLKRRHDRVVVIGHSMGGSLATLAVAREGADALILVAPYFGVTHRWWYGLRPETWTRLLAPVIPWVYKGDLFLQVNRDEAKDRIATYDWVPMQGLLTLQEIGRRARRAEVLDEVTCPVLLLHSTGDAAASFEASREAFEELGSREKRMIRYDRSNHHILWDWDGPEAAAAILESVGEAPPPDRGDTDAQDR